MEKWGNTEVEICMQSKLRLRFELEPYKGEQSVVRQGWLVRCPCIELTLHYLGLGLTKAHKNRRLDKVRACNYVKFETKWNLPKNSNTFCACCALCIVVKHTRDWMFYFSTVQ